VGADGGGVEDQYVQVGVAQLGEDRVPAAFGRPAVEPPPLAVAVAQPLGQVGPGGAGAGDPEDRAEETAVVPRDAAVLARPPGEQVLDAPEVGFGDRVPMAHGASPRVGATPQSARNP
jgi:hypothetical protein